MRHERIFAMVTPVTPELVQREDALLESGLSGNFVRGEGCLKSRDGSLLAKIGDYIIYLGGPWVVVDEGQYLFLTSIARAGDISVSSEHAASDPLNGKWLAVRADGREFLVAPISPETVKHMMSDTVQQEVLTDVFRFYRVCDGKLVRVVFQVSAISPIKRDYFGVGASPIREFSPPPGVTPDPLYPLYANLGGGPRFGARKDQPLPFSKRELEAADLHGALCVCGGMYKTITYSSDSVQCTKCGDERDRFTRVPHGMQPTRAETNTPVVHVPPNKNTPGVIDVLGVPCSCGGAYSELKNSAVVRCIQCGLVRERYIPAQMKRQVQVCVCPVCRGVGTVPRGFYGQTSGTISTPEICRTCRGAAILVVDLDNNKIGIPLREQEDFVDGKPDA